MSGTELWRYERDLDLCDVTASWEKVVAVYRDDRGCSQVTELDGGTGERLAQRSSDADSEVTLKADGTYVASLATAGWNCGAPTSSAPSSTDGSTRP